jgi:hypothetical protein
MRFNLKIRDTIAIGALAGVIGSIQISLINLIFSILDFTTTPGWKPFAELFFPKYSHSFLGVMVGFGGQAGISGLWGVLTAYVLRFTEKDYWWLKGMGIGIVSWLTTAGASLRVLDIAKQVYHRPADQLMVPLNLILFEITVAYLVKRFGFFEKEW